MARRAQHLENLLALDEDVSFWLTGLVMDVERWRCGVIGMEALLRRINEAPSVASKARLRRNILRRALGRIGRAWDDWRRPGGGMPTQLTLRYT